VDIAMGIVSLLWTGMSGQSERGRLEYLC